MRPPSPNAITTVRLALLPVLWVLALAGARVALGVLLLVAALTDVADGFVARRYGMVTARGSRLDSIADMLLIGSAVAWVVMFRPEVVRAHAWVLGGWLVFGIATLALGWFRFRRFANLHLYSAKAAGLIGFAFAVHALVAAQYSRALFGVAIAAALVATAETALVLLTRDSVDERIGSILLPRARRSARR